MSDNDPVREWAGAVAAALGDGWTATPGPWRHGGDAYLCGPQGAQILVHPAGHRQSDRGRLAIQGSIPEALWQAVGPGSGLDYRSHVRITVARSRPAQDVAREIRRRVLPEYAELIATARQRAAEWSRVVEMRDRARMQMVDAGASLGMEQEEDGARIYVGDSCSPVRGRVVIVAPGDVHVDLRMDEGDARAVLELLSERADLRA